MTSVTCQTAYVKCFQWSSCCSCTRVGGDGSLNAGPKCSASLRWPQSRTALAWDPQILVYVIHFETAPRLAQGHKPLLLPVLLPSYEWWVHRKTKTLETLCFDTSSEHFLCSKSLCIEGNSWGFYRESCIFASRVKTTNLLKVVIWTVDHSSGGWRVYFKRLLSLICL